MSHRRYLLKSAARLKELSSEDEQRLLKAMGVLKTAQDDVDVATAMAGASREALDSVQRRLSTLETPPPAAEPTSSEKKAPQTDSSADRPTVVELILAILRDRGEANRDEITDFVLGARPEVKTTTIGPELSRLYKSGRITRPRDKVYSLADETTQPNSN